MSNLIQRLPSESFIAKANPVYVDTFNLFPLLDRLSQRTRATVFVGPKGTGKSLAFAAWAAKNGWPQVTYDCSEDVRRSHLIGARTLDGDISPFVLGPLTTAVEVANECGKCLLDLEEINALSPQMQKVLNPLADWRKRIEVPEAKQVFKLNEGARLWLVGTMNTAVYGGVYDLNEDLKSRLRLIDVGYPEQEKEKQIVLANLAAQGIDAKDKILLAFLESTLQFVQESRQKALEYVLSPRDVVQMMEDYVDCGADEALKITLGKFDGDDKVTVIQRIQSHYGIKVKVAA